MWGIALSLFVGNEIEGGPANLYLRRHAGPIEWLPLLGPSSPTDFRLEQGGTTLSGRGRWGDISYLIQLTLAATSPTWFWRVTLENQGATEQVLDLTYAQDLALASYGGIRLNEFYVSQYLDHSALSHPTRGFVVASRQNLAVDGRNPWSLIGSLRNGAAYATDALQFYGLAYRDGAAPAGLLADLPSSRLQQEHSLVVIRDAIIRLEPGASTNTGFFRPVSRGSSGGQFAGGSASGRCGARAARGHRAADRSGGPSRSESPTARRPCSARRARCPSWI